MFHPNSYDIPYGALVAQEVDDSLVAGRCHSATAGAAMAVKSGRETAEIDGENYSMNLLHKDQVPLPTRETFFRLHTLPT